MDKEQGNRVIAFAQNAEFFERRAQISINKGQLIDAAFLMKKAAKLKSESPKYWLALAEILIQMQCYDQSLKTLKGMLWRCREMPLEAMQMMGVNYLFLGKIERAIELYNTLGISNEDTDLEEDSFEFDGDDFSDMMDFFSEVQNRTEIEKADDLQEEIYSLREMIVNDNENDVIKRCKMLLKKYPDNEMILEVMAMAYTNKDDTTAAINACNIVLDKNPDSLRANTAMAIIHIQMKEFEEAKKYAEIIAKSKTDDESILVSQSGVLYELKMFEQSQQKIKKLMTYHPYDMELMHRSALNCFMMDELEKAMMLWENILKVDENCYIVKCTLELINKNPEQAKIDGMIPTTLNGWVGFMLHDRMHELNEYNDGDQVSKELFDLTKWLFATSDKLEEYIKLLPILDAYNGADKEETLKDMLVSEIKADKVVPKIIKLLVNMGVKSPFITYCGCGILKLDEKGAEDAPQWIKDISKHVIKAIEENMEDSENLKDNAIEIWKKSEALFCRGLVDYKEFTHDELMGFAAACEYFARKQAKAPITQAKIKNKYNIKETAFRRAHHTIGAVIEIGKGVSSDYLKGIFE